MKRYGFSPSDVLKGLKAEGYSIFRKGRTICYREKIRTRNEKGELVYKSHTLYYLKKSVEIPARPFFYLTEKEMNLIMEEVGCVIKQL